MPSQKQNLYARAGITDVAEFYRTKFVSDEVLDERYFKALDRFDLRFARTMWVYDNVRAGSSVLELGCGAGMLALLKRKGVMLTGVDLSEGCALAARRNGYDATLSAKLSSLPFPDDSFDYVVSLDVLGHIESAEKDAVLAEIKRVQRSDGVTLHGIECTDHSAQRNYDEMSAEELRRFI
jgi:ubiquinone/menaquinone biosynthesis C-methylase UbiE